MDLRDPVIALDFDGAVLRCVWQHQDAERRQSVPPDRPIIVPNWDVRTVFE